MDNVLLSQPLLRRSFKLSFFQGANAYIQHCYVEFVTKKMKDLIPSSHTFSKSTWLSHILMRISIYSMVPA